MKEYNEWKQQQQNPEKVDSGTDISIPKIPKPSDKKDSSKKELQLRLVQGAGGRVKITGEDDDDCHRKATNEVLLPLPSRLGWWCTNVLSFVRFSCSRSGRICQRLRKAM